MPCIIIMITSKAGHKHLKGVKEPMCDQAAKQFSFYSEMKLNSIGYKRHKITNEIGQSLSFSPVIWHPFALFLVNSLCPICFVLLSFFSSSLLLSPRSCSQVHGSVWDVPGSVPARKICSHEFFFLASLPPVCIFILLNLWLLNDKHISESHTNCLISIYKLICLLFHSITLGIFAEEFADGQTFNARFIFRITVQPKTMIC